MLKTSAIVENEIRDYVTNKTRKKRGSIVSIDVKLNKDYYPKGIRPNAAVGGFVTFENGDRIFVYRFENNVNNFANGKGYGTYGKSYDSENAVKKVVVGWNTIGDNGPPFN